MYVFSEVFDPLALLQDESEQLRHFTIAPSFNVVGMFGLAPKNPNSSSGALSADLVEDFLEWYVF